MGEEGSILENNFQRATLILSFAIIIINISSIFIPLIVIKCKAKKIKKLRNKLFELIIIDTIIVLCARFGMFNITSAE